jgi:predicted transcriptional regulator
MSGDVVVRLPADIAERLDALAADELRSRNNAATWLIEQGLRRRVDGDWVTLERVADGVEIAAARVDAPETS